MSVGIIIAAAAMSTLSLTVVVWYWRDYSRALAQARRVGCSAQTACGPIGYTSIGEGPTLLMVHGWGGAGIGGFNMFAFLADRGFRVLSISRPGYFLTPLSVGETMEAQADAMAALLDALDIPNAAVICGSGGAPASLLFAERHSDRCWGLVLVSALTSPDAVTQTSALQDILEKLFESDFFIWIIAKFFWRGLVESGMGELNDEIRENPQKIAALRSIIDGLVLSGQAKAGMRNDMRQWRTSFPTFAFDQISVPTLIIHSRNDKSVPFAIAERTLSIPNTKSLIFDDGGHACYLVHSEFTEPATADFLKAHQPAAHTA